MEFEFEEEFQESDVIFSDDSSSSADHYQCTAAGETQSRRRSISRRRKLTINSMKRNRKSDRSSSCSSTGSSGSAPVDIPAGGSNHSSPSSSFRYDCDVEMPDFGFGGCDDDDDYPDMVPPHLIVDRRSVDGQIASSFERNVNTRRRNLIQVRNSILKLTGFLES